MLRRSPLPLRKTRALQVIDDSERIAVGIRDRHREHVNGLVRPLAAQSEIAPFRDLAARQVDLANLCERDALERIRCVHVEREGMGPALGRIASGRHRDHQGRPAQLLHEALALGGDQLARRRDEIDVARGDGDIEGVGGETRVVAQPHRHLWMKPRELLRPRGHHVVGGVVARDRDFSADRRARLVGWKVRVDRDRAGE
jgi:hypothetical protein